MTRAKGSSFLLTSLESVLSVVSFAINRLERIRCVLTCMLSDRSLENSSWIGSTREFSTLWSVFFVLKVFNAYDKDSQTLCGIFPLVSWVFISTGMVCCLAPGDTILLHMTHQPITRMTDISSSRLASLGHLIFGFLWEKYLSACSFEGVSLRDGYVWAMGIYEDSVPSSQESRNYGTMLERF